MKLLYLPFALAGFAILMTGCRSNKLWVSVSQGKLEKEAWIDHSCETNYNELCMKLREKVLRQFLKFEKSTQNTTEGQEPTTRQVLLVDLRRNLQVMEERVRTVGKGQWTVREKYELEATWHFLGLLDDSSHAPNSAEVCASLKKTLNAYFCPNELRDWGHLMTKKARQADREGKPLSNIDLAYLKPGFRYTPYGAVSLGGTPADDVVALVWGTAGTRRCGIAIGPVQWPYPDTKKVHWEEWGPGIFVWSSEDASR